MVMRLLVGEPQDQAQIARQDLERLAADGAQALVSDLVVSEAYFALQYHYAVPKKEALETLRLFLESGAVECLGVAGRVVATPNLETAQPGLVDRMIHEQYIEHADEMLTFEKAGRKLSRVRLLQG